ncbi:unnamed protein product [Heligmosomoides polygyrus]|uniref:Myb-like domain-containing protein n=1 Tax=Heligmosomoides polygyrus TaxID=6339 RepID=A0A3P8EPI1_HELPZ|nr:unnamed protein product [Heligmosomoides polygyrus]
MELHVVSPQKHRLSHPRDPSSISSSSKGSIKSIYGHRRTDNTCLLRDLSSSNTVDEEDRLPRKSKTWSHDEIMVFYEGLKQCGKDFDGVMRIMAKRKVDKNKEQTKNYYFNLLKHVKQSISLDEDIGRDAKELFITINACEWRRRTHTNQYIPERMKELIFHGCTTIPIRDKSKKKSVPVKIKTPPCPSLLKFFYSEFSGLQITNNLLLFHREPMLVQVSCEQNPLLRIRLNTNDRISRIFQLLRHKWSSALERLVSRLIK